MNTYGVRTMTLSDYDECFELWNIKGDASGRADSTNETFNKIISRNPETCFVAVADNKIIRTTTSAPTTITFDDVFDLFHSLRAPCRNKAVFIMNNATVKGLRKLKDSSGQYLWTPSVVMGTPDTLCNRTV